MNIPECFSCAGESMMFGELASAEGLVIHVPFLYQSVSAFLKTATTPVLIPPQDFITSGQKGLRTYLRIQIGNGFIITSTVDNIAGPTAGRIDLLQVLPTGRGQGCGQEGIAVHCGIAGRPQKAELEAFKATWTTFGHVGDADDRSLNLPMRRRATGIGRFDRLSDRTCLQPTDKGQPCGVIIFIINRFKAMRGGVAAQFVTTYGIFMERDDVGVAEEYSWTKTFTHHPLDDGGRTWSAAAVQQDALLREVTTFRWFWHKHFLMNIPIFHFHGKFSGFSGIIVIAVCRGWPGGVVKQTV